MNEVTEKEIRASAKQNGLEPYSKEADHMIAAWKAGLMTFKRDSQGRIATVVFDPDFLEYLEAHQEEGE
jgi:hypothetical protein